MNCLAMQAEGLDFLGLETVQAIHGLGHVLLEQDVGGAQGFVQRGLDQTLLTAGNFFFCIILVNYGYITE